MSSFVSQNKPGAGVGSPPQCLLLIVVNLSEVRPAISHRPATLDPAAADPGDHKLDTTGTAPSPSVGSWGDVSPGHVEALTMHKATGGQGDSDRTLLGPVLPDWVAHHFCESGLICLYSELVYFLFFNKGELRVWRLCG